MSVIATIALDAEDFMLGAAVTANSDIRIRFDRVVPIGDRFIPYMWAADSDVENIETALRAETDVTSFCIVEMIDGKALIRVEWSEQADGILDAIRETGATILEGNSKRSRWRFQLRFADHDDLSMFYKQCADRGIAIDLESIHNPGLTRDMNIASAPTEEQREMLRTALERGYFDVPRRINLIELGDEFGISDTAVSQRLRRGLSTILSEVLADPGEQSEDTP